MRTLENICYVKREHEDLTLNIYLPDASEFSVFVFFHGGGLEKGNKSTAERFAWYLTGKGIAVVAAYTANIPMPNIPISWRMRRRQYTGFPKT